MLIPDTKRLYAILSRRICDSKPIFSTIPYPSPQELTAMGLYYAQSDLDQMLRLGVSVAKHVANA